ncbi:MAG: amino acid ABC transporter substrate-binding protein [Oscillospiraceae bacterium]|nr:amino acid ABC transporter substrate-binding protein [Oscillospiraceae bacterium]
MKKNFIKALAALALAPAMLLAGCSSDGGNSDTAGNAADGAAEGNSASGEDNSLQKVLDSGKFVLGLDATFKPMGFTDEQDNIVGFDIDLAEEVCSRLGVELVKQPVDWDTKEQDLNAGKIDCIWNGLSINDERQEIMNLSEPYMKNDMIFVVKTDSEIATQADLDGKAVAVQSGSTAQEILNESGLNITATELATNVECLQQLDLDLVDAVFLDSVVANYEITTTGKAYTILPDGLSPEEYAIGFRKGDQALRDEVQKILSEMKADGKVEEISTKWFGSDITTIK